jgi:opacity protein-like surface antigen
VNKLSKIIISLSFYSALTSIAYGGGVSADERAIYLGTELGMVYPVQSKFKHKNSNTELTLKKSSMYSARVGYSFYPQMALEFSATHQPRYKLGYVLPKTNIVPKTPGITKVVSDIYMLNLVYELQPYNGFIPFVIGGAGIARVQVKPTRSFFMGREFFKIKTTNTNCLAWQIGLGLSKPITSRFSVDVSTKLQVAHSIKVKYDTLDLTTGQFNRAKPIKKTIGVAEFALGFTYKLPI